jgi:hypothetical protein
MGPDSSDSVLFIVFCRKVGSDNYTDARKEVPRMVGMITRVFLSLPIVAFPCSPFWSVSASSKHL